MLRYLFGLEISLAVLGASMTIGVGVSALLLGWHLNSSPQYHEQVLVLMNLTLAYTAVTVAAAVGALALHRQARWHWPVHAVMVAACFFAYTYSIQALTNT